MMITQCKQMVFPYNLLKQIYEEKFQLCILEKVMLLHAYKVFYKKECIFGHSIQYNNCHQLNMVSKNKFIC